MQKELRSLREARGTLDASNSELKATLRSREKQLAKLERDYGDLKSGSANYIKTKQLKDQLEIDNRKLKSQLTTLLERNKELERKIACGLQVEPGSYWLDFGINHGSSPNAPQATFSTLPRCLEREIIFGRKLKSCHFDFNMFHLQKFLKSRPRS